MATGLIGSHIEPYRTQAERRSTRNGDGSRGFVRAYNAKPDPVCPVCLAPFDRNYNCRCVMSDAEAEADYRMRECGGGFVTGSRKQRRT